MQKKNFKQFEENGFFYLESLFLKREIINLRKIVNLYFSKSKSYYSKMKHTDFYDLVLKAQIKIKKKILSKKFNQKIINRLIAEINLDKNILISSYIPMFVTRPLDKNSLATSETDTVSFHRDSFYGKKFLNNQINVWIPIFDLEPNQNLQYIPFSHKIKDNQIQTKRLKNFVIKKNSSAHKLGMLYAPKQIRSGVNLKKAKRFKVPKNHILIFKSKLIHGNAFNFSKKIRFTIAFGIIEKKHLIRKQIPINFREKLPHL